MTHRKQLLNIRKDLLSEYHALTAVLANQAVSFREQKILMEKINKAYECLEAIENAISIYEKELN